MAEPSFIGCPALPKTMSSYAISGPTKTVLETENPPYKRAPATDQITAIFLLSAHPFTPLVVPSSKLLCCWRLCTWAVIWQRMVWSSENRIYEKPGTVRLFPVRISLINSSPPKQNRNNSRLFLQKERNYCIVKRCSDFWLSVSYNRSIGTFTRMGFSPASACIEWERKSHGVQWVFLRPLWVFKIVTSGS